MEFHDRFFAVASGPDWVAVAFHAWVSVSPFVNVHFSSHGDTAAEELFAMVTPPWNPVPQLFTVVNVTLHEPVEVAVGVEVGVVVVGVVVGVTVGVAVGVPVGVRVGVMVGVVVGLGMATGRGHISHVANSEARSARFAGVRAGRLLLLQPVHCRGSLRGGLIVVDMSGDHAGNCRTCCTVAQWDRSGYCGPTARSCCSV